MGFQLGSDLGRALLESLDFFQRPVEGLGPGFVAVLAAFDCFPVLYAAADLRDLVNDIFVAEVAVYQLDKALF